LELSTVARNASNFQVNNDEEKSSSPKKSASMQLIDAET
jgi:hypothetical protein